MKFRLAWGWIIRCDQNVSYEIKKYDCGEFAAKNVYVICLMETDHSGSHTGEGKL